MSQVPTQEAAAGHLGGIGLDWVLPLAIFVCDSVPRNMFSIKEIYLYFKG